MYEVIKSVISAGGYKLGEIQHKVKKLWLQGDLTEKQADQLLTLASQGATPDAERPELLSMIQNLSEKVNALVAEVAALKGASGTNEPDSEEYEVWKPWDGISNKYQTGAIVSHGGKLWISTCSGQNVWEPGTVDSQFWIVFEG